MKNSKIIYSINVADIQDVAMEVLERKLTDEELEIIEHKVGDYIGWFESIEMAIEDHIN